MLGTMYAVHFGGTLLDCFSSAMESDVMLIWNGDV
jgi:hypothetical protein